MQAEEWGFLFYEEFRMFRKITIFSLILLTFFVFWGCCAIPTPYQPKASTGGYSDIQLDHNTVRVTFRGNAFLPKEKVEAYLLYRCAEVTLDLGFDYFVIVENVSDVTPGVISTPGIYTGSTYQYGYGTTTYGTYIPGQTIPIKKHTGSALIKLFKGDKPENIPDGFMAKELKGYLKPHIERPNENPLR